MTRRTATSKRELMRSILSTECPACEKVKLGGCMFCDDCYTRLDADTQGRIRNALRQLSEVIFAALEQLG